MGRTVNISLKVVEDLKIRQRREDEILGVCPVCSARDCNFNTSKMVYNCWHGGCSGKIIPSAGYEVKEVKAPVLDIPKIRNLYTSLTDEFHSSLTKSVKDYLKNRGLTDDTINKFKLGFCSTTFYEGYGDKIAEEAGIMIHNYPLLANRVVIPYIFNNETTDLRGRILESIFSYKKNTPTYLSLAGNYESRGAVYFFNHEIIDKNSTIILTEGEFKALVAAQYGFPIIATPGIMRWEKSWTALLKDKEVILAADNELVSKRRTPAYIQAKMLSKHLPNLKVATLFRRKGEVKMDVDSYIISRGVKSFEVAIKAALPVNDYLEIEERKGLGRC